MWTLLTEDVCILQYFLRYFAKLLVVNIESVMLLEFFLGRELPEPLLSSVLFVALDHSIHVELCRLKMLVH